MAAPIALFVYKRPTHTRRVIESLVANHLFADSPLWIFSDGPRNEEDVAGVEAVREMLRAVPFSNVRVVERERNMGLAESIIDGVGRLCEEYGRVIVVEDDLILAPHFLEYMNDALEHYDHVERVMQVSGYAHPVDITSSGCDAAFLPLTSSWGWATWARAWRVFNPAMDGYGRLAGDAALRKRFNLDDAYDYFGLLGRQKAGKVDSWAIRWYLSVFLEDGLVLYPRKTMVVNGGLDGSGTHCGDSGRFENRLDPEFRVKVFPDRVEIASGWHLVADYLRRERGTSARLRGYLRRWMDRVRRINAGN